MTVAEALARFGRNPPREICIVMLSAIGDAVHVLPVVNALKRAWPATRITWIIQPGPHGLVRGHAAIDEFIVFERRRGLRVLESYRALAEQLGERRFDLALGLQVYLKAGLITAIVPADIKLGFDRERAAEGQWLFTNRRVPPHPPQHVQDQYFEFLDYLGVPADPVVWGLDLSDHERQDQADFFARLDRPTCAVVLATSKPEKNWTPDGFARVVSEVSRTHHLQPVLVGGASALERAMAEEVSRASGVPVIDALGQDLRELLWLLDGSALTISPDTGPMHISRAVGTPVVSLFGHTNPRRYGPYRAFGDLVVDGYAEHPGEEYANTPSRRDGMRRVSPEAVLKKVSLAMTKYVHA